MSNFRLVGCTNSVEKQKLIAMIDTSEIGTSEKYRHQINPPPTSTTFLGVKVKRVKADRCIEIKSMLEFHILSNIINIFNNL